MNIACIKCFSVFFFNDTATTEIYTLSLHDALPISDHVAGHERRRHRPRQDRVRPEPGQARLHVRRLAAARLLVRPGRRAGRSEEHTSELQSRQYLVCRLLLEKKKTTSHKTYTHINP